MKYEEKNSDEVYQFIVNYTYLKSFDKNLIGSFIFPYYDIENNFDIISFYENKENVNEIEESIFMGDTDVDFVSLDKEALKSFSDEIANNYILCDKNGELANIKKVGAESKYTEPSNKLELDYDKLSSMLTEKFAEGGDNKYLKVYYTLVDFYYTIIMNTHNFDFKNFNKEIENLLEKKLVLAEYKDLHVQALLEAISLVEEKKLETGKQLKLVNSK